MIYEAQKDWWLAIPVGVIALGMACLGLFLMALGSARGEVPLIVTGAIELVVGALAGWMLLCTSYELRGNALRIELGPFVWKVPLDSIVEVVTTRKLLHSPGWSLAWSRDRVRIRSRVSMLPFWISPADQAGFLRDLQHSRPDLSVERG